MSYIDTTLTPEAGYTYVNQRQCYDAIAAQLAAHAAWVLVETVDYVPATYTHRTWVWKCKAASSGLPSDFFVTFTARMITATGVWDVTGAPYLQMSMGEAYDSGTHTLSKPAPVPVLGTAVTIGADLTHPATWVTTAVKPATIAYVGCGVYSSTTSARLLIGVTSDGVYISCNNGAFSQAYAGAMETLMSATDDPMPVVLTSNMGSSFNLNSYADGASTRHPMLTPSASTTYAFGMRHFSYYYLGAGARAMGSQPLLDSTLVGNSSGGTLGDPTNTAWHQFLGGPVASKCCISSGSPGGTGATRGGLRGFYKHFVVAYLATHSFGDTFVIDGKVYVGHGSVNYGLWDTTA